ncbi:Glycogen synthase kinase-3 beta [Nosema bombycis CQ1]|uniref:Glycogen synthase kinase-3 beta n=1 Tax=Nosema bombycis (strain CQ1 / CVCC 102059) TaxID=578461 RepID=R0KPV0_NOSB1|nr:Glycogen synthase kinase-3 beta [Nosema bombycis CQ1]|eukprot:EOB12741.1 Glycogen synthase kinase-3 beta [Nosema bombycis CQ1]
MKTLSQQKLDDSIVEIKSKWTSSHSNEVFDKNGCISKITFNYSKIIGKGSFGVVLKIKDTKGGIYALKRVFQDNRYYNRELDLLLKISHNHIANLKFYFYNEECSKGRFLNIFMDFHPNNLEDQILLQVPKSLPVLVKYFYQICLGLQYLHENKICHRDIKPSNILLDKNDNIKICDFGNAKKFDNEDNISYICSRYYRSPENLLGNKNYSFKIDVWSAGCVIAELRTFTPLFKGKSGMETLGKIRSILKITESDYLESGWKRSVNRNAPGIKQIFEFCD